MDGLITTELVLLFPLAAKDKQTNVVSDLIRAKGALERKDDFSLVSAIVALSAGVHTKVNTPYSIT